MAVATDYIVTDADINRVHVEAQPDALRGSATENKKVFDKYCDEIARHFNDLCYFIASDTSAVIDRTVLLLYESIGWIQD